MIMEIISNWSLDANPILELSEEHQDAMMQINRDKAIMLIPVIVYICVLMVLGIVGNPIAFYIYGWKWPDTSTRIFLLYLAEIDFVNCIVTMPTEIYVTLNFFYFRSAFFCTLSRFFTYTYNNSTSIIFLVIAFDRYIRICHPHRQTIGITGSKTACFVSLCVAVAVSWPALFLYGSKYVSLHYKNQLNDTITGVICDVKNNMDRTPYPLMFFIYLWCGFTSSLCILTILYTRLARVILKRQKSKSIQSNVFMNTKKRSEANTDTVNNKETFEMLSDDTERKSKKQKKVNLQVDTSENVEVADIPNPQLAKKNRGTIVSVTGSVVSRKQGSMRGPGSTLMIFAITAIFLVTFLPFLIILTIRQYSGPGFYPSLSPLQQVLVNFFSRSYLINSCSNPIVYGLFNTQFRQEVYKLFRRGSQQPESDLSKFETFQRPCSISP